MFQLAERRFDRPPSVVEGFELFGREFFPWEIRHGTFVGIIADGEPASSGLLKKVVVKPSAALSAGLVRKGKSFPGLIPKRPAFQLWRKKSLSRPGMK